MAPQIQNLLKKRFLVVLFLMTLFLLQVSFAQAQVYKLGKNRSYYGFNTSFGTRSFTIQSGIPQLSNLKATQAGGQLGLIAGNCVWQFRLGLLGYYGATGNSGSSIDLYENQLSTNFYPLSLLTKKSLRISPYVITGITNNRAKFSGHFDDKDGGKVNYSTVDLPYAGTINVVRATVGTGIAFKLIDSYDFVHFFSEVAYGFTVSQSTKSSLLADTSIGNQLTVNVGLRFGGHRLAKRY